MSRGTFRPFLIVGNKMDLEDQRQVSSEEGRALAKKYGVFFIETSAKTKQNVNEAQYPLCLTNLIREGGECLCASDAGE